METTHSLTKPVPPMWEEPLSAWITTMRSRGYRDRSVDTRVRHVRYLARGPGTGNPFDVTPAQLTEWCAERQWKPETRHAHYQSFRLFYAHLLRDADGVVNPAEALGRVKRHVSPPRPAPEQALTAAIRAADECTRLILSLAAMAGLRASEIAQVNARDLTPDLTGTSLLVHGKGGADRLVPLIDSLGRQVRDRCAQDPGGWAFPGQINGHLSPAHVSKLAAGVLPRPWRLHTLRHRFATRAYAADRDILAVRQLLGHVSVETTQRYTQIPGDALINAARGARLDQVPAIPQ